MIINHAGRLSRNRFSDVLHIGGFMNKQPKITEETRRKFIEAFIRLNRNKEIDKITVREITEIAGYNRCTFYRYFADVYAVLEAIEDDILKDAGKIIMDDHAGTTLGSSIVDAFISLHERNHDRLSIVLSPYNRFHFIERLKKELMPVFQKTFTEGAVSVRSEYLLDIFFIGMISILSRWIHSDDEIEKKELTKIAESFFKNWLLRELPEQNHTHHM